MNTLYIPLLLSDLMNEQKSRIQIPILNSPRGFATCCDLRLFFRAFAIMGLYKWLTPPEPPKEKERFADFRRKQTQTTTCVALARAFVCDEGRVPGCPFYSDHERSGFVGQNGMHVHT